MTLYSVIKEYSQRLRDCQNGLRRDTFRDTSGHSFFGQLCPLGQDQLASPTHRIGCRVDETPGQPTLQMCEGEQRSLPYLLLLKDDF